MIQKIPRTVYFAPTARRHFFTAKAAASREASAIIRRAYPSERPETDDSGRTTFSGWNWRCDPHLVAVHKRLVRFLVRKIEVTV